MKTYAVVGLGGRSLMFRDAILKTFSDSSKLLAICDLNEGRIKLALNHAQSFGDSPDTYHSDDFDKMLNRHKPNIVIVCTKDSTHHDYICRALEAGSDVITEKPMTIDHHKCQRIIDTVKKTGKSVRVTFNYRYSPPRSQIKQLLMDDTIGQVLSVDFQWMLDTNHGADYFRRWHRNKQNSGGLLVHKAAHHFDLINWWIGSGPYSVMADGGRVFYNEAQARRYGLENHSSRCLDCPVSNKCSFYLDMNSYDIMRELYVDCEKFDGYHRDSCIFSNDIDIEDIMNVAVKYKNGVYMSYCLNAFAAWEGYRVAFNGTKGRLEQICHESSYVSGDGSIAHAYQPKESKIIVYPHFQTPYLVEVEEGKGGHGGGDFVLLNDIFGTPDQDPLKRSADYVQGSYSILVGIAANESMKTSKKVLIDDLVKNLDNANYPINSVSEDVIPYVYDSSRVCNGLKMDANIPLKVEAPQ